MPLFQNRFSGLTALGTRWMFTWWADSTASTGDVNDAAETWLTEFWTDVAGIISDVVAADLITTVEIDEASGDQVFRVDSVVDLDGTATENPLPADVAVVVSLRTNTPTRSGRGRFYLPQLASTALNADGRISSAAVTTLADGLDDAWDNFSSTGVPVLYSRTNRTTLSLVSFDIGNLWDSQRGRDGRAAEERTSRSF